MDYPAAKNRFILAPLAGITDAAFRLLCAEKGAGLCFTEMISANGIKYENLRTFEMLDAMPEEGKIGVQLFGYDPETVANTASVLEQRAGERIALFDINMGCPARKIVGNNEGSALMRDEKRAAEIMKRVKKAVSLPVTAKFRKGWDDDSVNAVSFAMRLEDAGADALTVHGRTRMQFFDGKCDREIIAAVKNAVSIPVAGNGDIFSAEEAISMMEETGCDAVMVARGALGNPFIFSQIAEYVTNGSYNEPTIKERMDMAVRHATIACENKGERIAVKQMRKHAAWYIKGIRNASQMRARLVHANTLAELCEMFGEIASLT